MVQELRAVTFQLMDDNRAPFWMSLWDQTAHDPFMLYLHEGRQPGGSVFCMLASELHNAHVCCRSGQAIFASWTIIRSLFPSLLEESETGGQEASQWGGSFLGGSFLPSVAEIMKAGLSRHCKLKCVWPGEKSECGHKAVILMYLKTQLNQDILLNVGHMWNPGQWTRRSRLWFLVIRAVWQWLPCEAGCPSHGRCSGTGRCLTRTLWISSTQRSLRTNSSLYIVTGL